MSCGKDGIQYCYHTMKNFDSTLLISPSLFQLQEVLLSYIANPQLELALVMLIVPFIVNVSPAVRICLSARVSSDVYLTPALLPL